MSQSALLEQTAIKSKPASYAESCGVKSIVPPRRSSVKATIALAYTISTQLSANLRTARKHMQCTTARMQKQSASSSLTRPGLAPQSVSLDLKSEPAKGLVPLKRRSDKVAIVQSLYTRILIPGCIGIVCSLRTHQPSVPLSM